MSAKPHRHSGSSKAEKSATSPNSKKGAGFSPSDFEKIGPRSIEGVEASDLPDARGPVETNLGKELRRKLPQNTGAINPATDVGLRGEPDIADAEEHGHRKHN